MMDFGSVLDGFLIGMVVMAVIAAGGLIELVGFAMWARKKVVYFFG